MAMIILELFLAKHYFVGPMAKTFRLIAEEVWEKQDG